MIDLVEALAAAEQPEATFAALERLVDERVGARLFTVMTLDRDRGVASRRHSSRPDVYPTSGEKPLEDGRWSEIVVARREPFVANSLAEIAEVFPDHALIASLGCASCLNLPIVIGDAVAGTLNCLHEAGHYTPGRVAAADALRLPGALALLAADRYSRRTRP